uniref:transcription factor HES-5-like n=1 Tax=Pristiophorus japonicus TaxID=55135 RepID=UPI00398EE688
MSPSSPADQRPRECTEHSITPRDQYRLMKPMAEKRRRDRINRSILQLKGLLEGEFHRDQGNCKLEKAAILETSVNFLKYHRLLESGPQAWRPLQDYNDGYARCLRETLCFLSAHQTKMAAPPELLQRLHGARGGGAGSCDTPVTLPQTPPCQTPAKQVVQPGTRTLWRPWQI